MLARMILPLMLSAVLLAGCKLPSSQVIPDPSIPHKVSREVNVMVYTRGTDGSYVEQRVRMLPGWWIASPQLIGK